MTVSTADLGGTGNGLGLPIANPLYGPATAAAMGQQAWGQNMQNAQATTAETQARTNRMNQLVPAELQLMQAQAGLAGSQAKNVDSEALARNLTNEATAGVPVDTRSSGIVAGIRGEIAKSNKAGMDNYNQWYVGNADRLDALQRQGPQGQAEVDRQIAQAANQNGLPVNQIVSTYGSAAAENARASSALNSPDTGPGNAAQQGPHAALASSMLRANERYAQSSMEQGAQTQRTRETLTSQQQIAQAEIKSKMDMLEKQLSTNPETAATNLANIAADALNRGDMATYKDAEQRVQSIQNIQDRSIAVKAFMQQFMMYRMLGMEQGAATPTEAVKQLPGHEGENTGQSVTLGSGNKVTVSGGPPSNPLDNMRPQPGSQIAPPGAASQTQGPLAPPQGQPPQAPGPTTRPAGVIPMSSGAPGNATMENPTNGWQIDPQVQAMRDQQAANVYKKEFYQTALQNRTDPLQLMQGAAQKLTTAIQQAKDPTQKAFLMQHLRMVRLAIEQHLRGTI